MAERDAANQTVYFKNLPTRISKHDLKHHLYCLCSIYGQIIDLVALKTARMRGQAFVVFKEVSSAVAALRALQGFGFFGKPMQVEFARTKSKAAQDFDRYVLEPARIEALRASRAGYGAPSMLSAGGVQYRGATAMYGTGAAMHAVHPALAQAPQLAVPAKRPHTAQADNGEQAMEMD